MGDSTLSPILTRSKSRQHKHNFIYAVYFRKSTVSYQADKLAVEQGEHENPPELAAKGSPGGFLCFDVFLFWTFWLVGNSTFDET